MKRYVTLSVAAALWLAVAIGTAEGTVGSPPADSSWVRMGSVRTASLWPVTAEDRTGAIPAFSPVDGRNAQGRTASSRFRPGRFVLWGTANAGAAVIAYRQSQAAWGASSGKFHFKDDWRGDGLALSDEFSHLFASYRLSQVVYSGYSWTGVGADRARRLAAIEAWAWMFLVEFPIDAFNPEQGFGVSDLVFNTAGVIAAYARGHDTAPRWDIKISVKRSFLEGRSRLIAYTNAQYDDYIYWLTIRPVRHLGLPQIGVGYSTAHDARPGIIKELRLGVGYSLDQVGELLGRRAARLLRPFNFFFFNLNVPIRWR